jgi:hypothetical protein
MRTSFAVNDMTIHRIVEQEAGFTPMLDFLPTLSKETLGENLSWLAPGGYDSASGNVVLCFQSYVVKTPHHNILVDSCIGNDKNFHVPARRPRRLEHAAGEWPLGPDFPEAEPLCLHRASLDCREHVPRHQCSGPETCIRLTHDLGWNGDATHMRLKSRDRKTRRARAPIREQTLGLGITSGV